MVYERMYVKYEGSRSSLVATPHVPLCVSKEPRCFTRSGAAVHRFHKLVCLACTNIKIQRYVADAADRRVGCYCWIEGEVGTSKVEGYKL